VSEAAVQTGIARARAGTRPAAPGVDTASILAALADVADPEIPVVSVIDLGMVGEIRVGADGIGVDLLPTYIGCPALDVIRTRVEARLRAFDRPVEVRFDFRVPWTSDRITPAGREALRASGFAPPGPALPEAPILIQLGRPVDCPNCGSDRTSLENAFGPTRCRAIYHCTACQQPFESFKTI
jgi:ring-1,2-phenylacetyl-CoA epoxidase subunit PaaD